jgi:hypothetical protein
LEFRLEAEKFAGAVTSRVFFKGKNASADDNYFVKRNITLHEQAKEQDKCITDTAYIKVG